MADLEAFFELELLIVQMVRPILGKTLKDAADACAILRRGMSKLLSHILV